MLVNIVSFDNVFKSNQQTVMNLKGYYLPILAS